jgi:hypothetical protein
MQDNKLRIGIELDHVIRNINKSIAKCYAKEYDENLELDKIDYTSDVLNEVCKFQSGDEKITFLYEDYPLEIFGHAPQMTRNLSRDLNEWLLKLTDIEEKDIEVFFYSLREIDLTIQSTYFFLSKIGTRVRSVVFPMNVSELMQYGDVFITANKDVIRKCGESKKVSVLMRMGFNKESEGEATMVFDSMKEFIDNMDNVNLIINKDKELKEYNKSCQTKRTTISNILSTLTKWMNLSTKD